MRGVDTNMRISNVVPILLLALSTALVLPNSAQGQSGDLLRSIRQGGGWVAIPIAEGSGTMQSTVVPTLGLTLSGCVQVWPGHSGEWTLEARDPVNDGKLDVTTTPGRGVPFSYRTGARSQVDLQVRWSERRDTTLLLWVGLEGLSRDDRDACTPVYDEGSGGR